MTADYLASHEAQGIIIWFGIYLIYIARSSKTLKEG